MLWALFLSRGTREVWWVDPSWQVRCPPAGWGRQSEGQMREKLVCWGKGSLVKEKRKRNQTTDAKASLTTSHQQPMARQPLSNGLFWHSSTTPSFTAEPGVQQHGKSLGSLGGSCAGRGLSLLPSPTFSRGKALRLCKHCSEIAKALLCYQHCFGLRSKTQHCPGCWY